MSPVCGQGADEERAWMSSVAVPGPESHGAMTHRIDLRHRVPEQPFGSDWDWG